MSILRGSSSKDDAPATPKPAAKKKVSFLPPAIPPTEKVETAGRGEVLPGQQAKAAPVEKSAAQVQADIEAAMKAMGVKLTESAPPGTAPTRPLNVPGIPGSDGEPVNTALVNGVWQTDSSAHIGRGPLTGGQPIGPSATVPAQNGARTLKVLYLFAGVSRKASLCEY